MRQFTFPVLLLLSASLSSPFISTYAADVAPAPKPPIKAEDAAITTPEGTTSKDAERTKAEAEAKANWKKLTLQEKIAKVRAASRDVFPGGMSLLSFDKGTDLEYPVDIHIGFELDLLKKYGAAEYTFRGTENFDLSESYNRKNSFYKDCDTLVMRVLKLSIAEARGYGVEKLKQEFEAAAAKDQAELKKREQDLKQEEAREKASAEATAAERRANWEKRKQEEAREKAADAAAAKVQAVAAYASVYLKLRDIAADNARAAVKGAQEKKTRAYNGFGFHSAKERQDAQDTANAELKQATQELKDLMAHKTPLMMPFCKKDGSGMLPLNYFDNGENLPSVLFEGEPGTFTVGKQSTYIWSSNCLQEIDKATLAAPKKSAWIKPYSAESRVRRGIPVDMNEVHEAAIKLLRTEKKIPK